MIKILIVDDEPDIKSLFLQKFRRKIHNKEWSFVFCYNGEEALQTLKTDPEIDLVLSDINMPKMDGLSLLDQIRKHNLETKTIIISAYGDLGNIRTAMNRGAFDFITKPIDFQDVEATLNKTIKHSLNLKSLAANKNKLLSLTKELELAKKIQKSILPSPPLPNPHYDIFSKMIFAKQVGGDYYDFFKIDKNHLGFAIADVSGKGISSALFAVVNQTLLKSLAFNFLSPKKCIESLNKACSINNSDCMFATLFYGVLNLTNGRLTYTNAGHIPPYVLNPKEGIKTLSPTGDIPVGVKQNSLFNENTINLNKGEFLFLYTDGVTEANNPKGEDFGEENLKKLLSQHLNSIPQVAKGASPEATKGADKNHPPQATKKPTNLAQMSQKTQVAFMGESVLKSVRQFAGEAKQYDDITMLFLQYKG